MIYFYERKNVFVIVYRSAIVFIILYVGYAIIGNLKIV